VRAALLTLLVLTAGCFGAPPAPEAPSPQLDRAAITALIGAPIEVDHDHNDAHLHTGRLHLEHVAWNPLGVELGRNGFANFVFHETDRGRWIFIAVDGDADGGFLIVDADDPHDLQTVGRYWIRGSGIQEVRVVPGGRYAILNVQDTPATNTLLAPQGAQDCSVCLHVVDVLDPGEPRLSSVFAVDLLGSHNMHVHVIGSEVYVFYVGQPLTNAPPGNYVGIARFVETDAGAHLVKVAEYRHHDAYMDPKRSFPHDVIATIHPLTQQHLLWVSHWEGGAITVDVTNPLAPRELSVVKDPAPSDVANIHWYAPEPQPRGDRLFAWSAPEIGRLISGSGVIRAYDATDPGHVRQVGTWALPGNVTIPSRYIFSPHITDVDPLRGLVAVSHYHAGVWILDATDPTDAYALGYYLPHGDPAAPYDGALWWKKPNFSPEGYGPNVYQARWGSDGRLWVSDRGTGLYVIEYTGPVPGPLA
jgi:hypothetical protein